jgi:hypothetical protein
MKKQFLLSALLLPLAIAIAAVGHTQTTQQRAAASLAGVWKGYFPDAPPDAPAVELSLKVQSGKPEGTAIFYTVVNSGAGAEIKGKDEAPLIDPVFDGQVLVFQVKRPDGSLFTGKVKFVAENEAVLSYLDRDTGDELAMDLRREK